jgi:phosphoribosyl-ATP pyrophosphohydrolase
VSEEVTETLLASKRGDKLHLVREVADLWFHTLVLLAWHRLKPEDVLAELHHREGISGLEEMAIRAQEGAK